MNVDSLNIQIKSSATDARKSIDGLISSLKNLNKQLGLKEGAKFVSTINAMSSAIEKLTSNVNGMGNMAAGFNKAASSAEGVSKATQNAADNTKQLLAIVDKVSKGFGDYSKMIDRAFQLDTHQAFDSKPFAEITKKTEKLLPAIIRDNSEIENLVKNYKELGNTRTLDVPTKEADKMADDMTDRIGLLISSLNHYKKLISDIESGKSPYDSNVYKEAIIGSNIAQKELDDYKKSLIGVEEETKEAAKPALSFTNDVLPNLLVLKNSLEKVSQKYDSLAQKGTNLFKGMLVPLKLAAREYVEKFEGMKTAVTGLRDHLAASLTKMSQFWAKTMRTFTFMLVRKAITGIIKEIGNAINSLAKFSDTMGTQFNQSMSNLVADFQYLARSIVSVFAPLIDMIAPIIDAIINKIATLLAYIGMLFAALGGSSTFTKATKTTTNYAKSLDKAAKSANHLTMGIDELNILANSKGGGGGGGGGNPLAQWDNVEIPPGIKKLADTLKKMWDDFLRPIKAAWDKMKGYVKEAWTYMLDQVKKLGKSIWDAFIQVWNEPKTIEMIANIFGIIADLMMVIGNLCKNFRESWDEVVDGATRGVQIFEGIRDIFAILIEHVRNVTKYMVEWSEGIDFDPLLDSVIKLLHSFYRLADFIGGVFEDVMKNVVLEYIEWMTEEGIPHLNNTIAEVLDAFNFDKIREDLVPVETAFENMLENIHTGVTNAMGNLGKQVADFANSQQFTDFMQRIADIMNLISAEDVEKILTGLGQGILDIADAIVKFVNSDIFMAFLKAIDEWFKNTSSKDIAGILKGVAVAIGLFKFGAFVSGGAAKFIGFLASFGSLIKVVEAVSKLVELAGGIEAVGAALEVFGGINAIIAGSITAIAAFFKMWNDGWSLAGEIIKDVGIALVAIGAVILGVAAAPAAIVAAVVAALSALVIVIHDHWDQIVNFFTSTIPAWWEGTALPFLQSIPSKIAEFFANLWNTIKTWASDKASAIAQWFNSIGEKISEFVTKAGEFFQQLPGKIGYALGFALGKVIEWGISLVQWAVTNIPIFIENIITWFRELPGKIWEWLTATIQKLVEWGANVIAWIAENVSQFIENIVNWFKQLPEKIWTHLVEIITKLSEWYNNAVTWITTNIPLIVDSFLSFFREIPQKLFDLGASIIQGLLDGINKAWEDLKGGVADFCGGFIQGFKDALGIASPSKEAEDIGDYWLEGLVLPLQGANINDSVAAFAEKFIGLFKSYLSPEKFTVIGTAIANAISVGINNGLGAIIQTLNNIYLFIVQTINTQINTLSTTLQTMLMPMFTNIFTQFTAWFSEAMSGWWADSMVFWFTASKWDEDIFSPLAENIHEHFELFSTWWDTSMNTWWEDQVVPWFEEQKWTDEFTHILEAAKAVFTLVEENIQQHMETAQEIVEHSCNSMKEAIHSVMDEIDELIEKMKQVPSGVSFHANGFASGGFPSIGSLFFANEAGPELVGTIHGNTAVANNNEITGIREAVLASGNQESELLARLITITQALLDKEPVVIDDRDIARMATSGQGRLGMNIIT